MKTRTALAAIFLLCLLSSLPAQANRKKATVSTTAQLLKSIGPNMEIILKPGVYALENAQNISGKYLEWRTDGGANELVIKGLRNLVLRGQDTEAASAVRTKDDGAFVLIFESCDAVTVESLNFSHDVPGPCQAGVVFLSNCSDFSFKDCLLSGSGSVGVYAEGCSGLSFENTSIADCSSGGVEFRDVDGAAFSGCLFTGNQAYPLIASNASSDIEFRECSFTGNSGDAVADGETAGGEGLRFIICGFNENAIAAFAAVDPPPYIENCQFAGNDFVDPSASPYADDYSDDYDDPGMYGTGPGYYIHDSSGLAFLYPNSWELEEDGEMVGFADPSNGAVAFFIPLCEVPNNLDAAKSPVKAFAPALDAYSKIIKDEMDMSVKAQAKGAAQGLDYLPYRDYEGTLGSEDMTMSIRLRVFACEGRLWGLTLMAVDAASIDEGTDIDLIMSTADYASRGE